MVCYNITGFEDTRGTIIIVDVFNIIQEMPDTDIHLKVDEEHVATPAIIPLARLPHDELRILLCKENRGDSYDK